MQSSGCLCFVLIHIYRTLNFSSDAPTVDMVVLVRTTDNSSTERDSLFLKTGAPFHPVTSVLALERHQVIPSQTICLGIVSNAPSGEVQLTNWPAGSCSGKKRRTCRRRRVANHDVFTAQFAPGVRDIHILGYARFPRDSRIRTVSDCRDKTREEGVSIHGR